MNKLLISTALLSITSLSALAGHRAETNSTNKIYDVERGFAQTLSISETEQIGKFRAVLTTSRTSKKHHSRRGHHQRKRLVLSGVIKGVINPDFTLNHTFVNQRRTGALYTANDTITNIYAGDPTCNYGTGTVPFEVEETLNIVAGTGIYANVEPGSTILLKGVINNCPSLPKYGQNTFDVIGGSVTINQ